MRTPDDVFYSAIQSSDYALVQLELSLGVDLNAQDDSDITPLVEAINCDDARMVHLLLASGADPNVSNQIMGAKAIHDTKSADVARVLIEFGADINARDMFGATPLHDAVAYPEVVKLLIEYGADVDAQDGCGLTPLHFAMQSEGSEHPGAIEYLIEAGADETIVDHQGQTALERSAPNSLERLRLLSAIARRDAARFQADTAQALCGTRQYARL